MDDEDDIRPLNPSTAPPRAAKMSAKKSMIACVSTGVMVSCTFMILIFQPRSPDMQMYDAMDWSADPCQDFYQYACGTWIATTTLPAAHSTFLRSFSNAEERNMQVVTDITIKATDDDFSMIGNYFKACMDIDSLNILGATPVQPNITFTVNTWQDAMTKAGDLQHVGYGMFWAFSVDPDEVNNTRNIFGIDQGGLVLPMRIYTKGDNETLQTLNKYTEHIAGMFQLAGVTSSPVDAAVMAAKAVRFEVGLARCSIDQHELLDPRATYHPMTFPQLMALSPNIPWSAWMATAMPGPLPPMLNVAVPAYFANISMLIGRNDSDLSAANLEAYMKWHVINDASLHLSMAFVDAHFQFFGVYLNGERELPPRQRICVERTHAALTDLVVAEFLKAVYDESTDKTAHLMVSQLIDAFRVRLQTIDWMDAATKANATIKLNAIVPMVAGPTTQELRNYSTVDVKANDLFGNWLRVNRNAYDRDLEKLPLQPDRLKWHMAADEVNAYYDPSTNTIVFPVGILEPTFYIQGANPSLNFGGVGSVIGHEMTHGFDNQGRLFDQYGNLRDWWTPQSATNFDNRTQCVIDYYTHLGGDGRMSLSENLADMGGVKTAFAGYQTQQAADTSMPIQAPLTPDQKFFVAYAQNWCALQTPQAAKMQILTDVHSLSPFRVQGPLANFDQFAKAFNCPYNTTYNPITRCDVW